MENRGEPLEIGCGRSGRLAFDAVGWCTLVGLTASGNGYFVPVVPLFLSSCPFSVGQKMLEMGNATAPGNLAPLSSTHSFSSSTFLMGETPRGLSSGGNALRRSLEEYPCASPALESKSGVNSKDAVSSRGLGAGEESYGEGAEEGPEGSPARGSGAAGARSQAGVQLVAIAELERR